MSKRWLFLLVAAAAASWALKHRHGTPLKDEVAVSQSNPIPIQVLTEVPSPPDPARIRKPIPGSTARRARSHPDDSVEFRIVDGLAIAFGDVIVGQSTGSNVERGRFAPPRPQLWPSPEIPYAISPDLPHPERVQMALSFFQQTTVVRFVPYSGQGDGVFFERGNDNCFASLGRLGTGLQPVKLADGCGTGEIMHEIMHVLGFIHEQSRPDRDQFIAVLWDNIEDQYRDQYAVAPETLAFPLRGSSFDFRSLMLYRPDTFAKHAGLDTMRSKEQGRVISPMTNGLSVEDIRRVNKLFGREGGG
jgi:hypothetical protein